MPFLCKEQSAKCRIIRNLVGAIHESPENERLSFIMAGGGTLLPEVAIFLVGECLGAPENKRFL